MTAGKRRLRVRGLVSSDVHALGKGCVGSTGIRRRARACMDLDGFWCLGCPQLRFRYARIRYSRDLVDGITHDFDICELLPSSPRRLLHRAKADVGSRYGAWAWH